MRILWLCNRMPGVVSAHALGKPGSGLWTDHVLSDLRREDHRIHILAPGPQGSGHLDETCGYALFTEGAPQTYLPELETWMGRQLEEFSPDLIHIWGTEFGHTLAMVNACEKRGLLDRVAVSIQGLCSVYAPHYAEGVPYGVCHSFTLRDLLKQDNIAQQQKTFEKRGALETEALKKVRHVIGRTDWDRACTYAINPNARYHHCNETLREEFYEGQWSFSSCQKHRVFASSCAYPIKGFHYLLEAMAQIKKDYPDAVLAVTGRSFLKPGSWKDRLKTSGYQAYMASLAKRYGLEDSIVFLGGLSAQAMKEEYLKAHVFALPSTIENSPNSLGEAMLLGVPCVASDVGGVTTMLNHGTEGYVYQSTAPYMLAHYIRFVFEDPEKAGQLARRARQHAARTHDPKQNFEDLLSIYKTIAP